MVEVSARPSWPYRLPAGRGADGVSRTRDGVWERLLVVEGNHVLVRAWMQPDGSASIAAMGVPDRWLHRTEARLPASPSELERAVELARHALALDDDLSAFYARFKRDPLLGGAIRRRPWLRIGRCPDPWEAFAWAVTEQLIEASEAARIQQRMIERWGEAIEVPGERRPLRTVPAAATIAELSPAEITACGLAPKRSLALIGAAREIAAGRCDPSDPADDRRLLAISEIGPWTVQVLGVRGRGDHDALPSGDLAYVKLVGHLAGLGRRSTVDEVESYFAPYA
ncbi:MAG: DNA-3-methyladenine glycosylase 2, partial [Solirubrobacterales bacterium]